MTLLYCGKINIFNLTCLHLHYFICRTTKRF